jgi:hypothetical protein
VIDLASLVQEKTVIVPISGNSFQYNRKRYSVAETPDGWYTVAIKSNRAVVLEAYFGDFSFIDKKSTILGYTIDNEFLFSNFDVGRRKTGHEAKAILKFSPQEGFTSVKAVYWEDKNLYYLEPNYSDSLIYDVKIAYDDEKSLKDVKGITPELRTLYILHDMKRQQLRAIEEAAKKKQAYEELLKSLIGRLTVSINNAGGQLIDYQQMKYRGQDAVVINWKLKESGTRFNSVLEANTLRVIEAGYCMSGDDRRHNLTSLVMTAQEYEADDLIYITRS